MLEHLVLLSMVYACFKESTWCCGEGYGHSFQSSFHKEHIVLLKDHIFR